MPKELGKLANLKVFNVYRNKIEGQLSIRSEHFIPFCADLRFRGSGEVPVALLRWKFIENRTAKLKGNAGLMLPSNIGKLGDSVTKIDLSLHNLRGEFSTRSERFDLRD